MNQYPDHQWGMKIEQKILNIVGEVFDVPTSVDYPKGITEGLQNQVLYAVDSTFCGSTLPQVVKKHASTTLILYNDRCSFLNDA